MVTYDSLFLMLQFGMILLAMLTFIDNRSNKRRR
ncbi:putative holin-like toxin [Anaerocolumna sp. MB42-C2]|nr:putative holin-like toxin [Anaerocolumna sp. MB42-C2]WMJ89653.1 putative holin-like toxin [Anaerocolumna sp. MB42-C2]